MGIHLSQFPQETQDYIYRLMYKAIQRAKAKGEFDPVAWNAEYELEKEKEEMKSDS